MLGPADDVRPLLEVSIAGYWLVVYRYADSVFDYVHVFDRANGSCISGCVFDGHSVEQIIGTLSRHPLKLIGEKLAAIVPPRSAL